MKRQELSGTSWEELDNLQKRLEARPEASRLSEEAPQAPLAPFGSFFRLTCGVTYHACSVGRP